MNRLLKITVAALLSAMLFFDGNQSVNARSGDPCAQVGMCISAGTEAEFPDFPTPVFLCPWPDGSAICCTTCNDDDDDFKEGS